MAAHHRSALARPPDALLCAHSPAGRERVWKAAYCSSGCYFMFSILLWLSDDLQ